MRKHEDFEELAALVAIGELSKDEYAELWEHLRGCDGCRRTSEQVDFILDQLPLPSLLRMTQTCSSCRALP
jgi:hypothetical protein